MSARAGFVVMGWAPTLHKGGGVSYDKKARAKPLTPPFASRKAADEFADDLRKRKYIISGVKWVGGDR